MYAKNTCALDRRLTAKYVGTYQYLDEWETMGTITTHMLPVEHTNDKPGQDECDPCDPTVQRGFALVKLNEGIEATADEIARAIGATFTKSGCHHDWDCCGCRSMHARAKHVQGRIYRLTITSSRNY